MPVSFVFRHGLARTDYYIMNDPSLSFMTTIKTLIKSHSVSPDPNQMSDKDLERKGEIL